MRLAGRFLALGLFAARIAMGQDSPSDLQAFADKAEIIVVATMVDFDLGPGSSSGPVIRGRPCTVTFLDYGTIEIRQILKGTLPGSRRLPILLPRRVIEEAAPRDSLQPDSLSETTKAEIATDEVVRRHRIGSNHVFFLRKYPDVFYAAPSHPAHGRRLRSTRYVFEAAEYTGALASDSASSVESLTRLLAHP